MVKIACIGSTNHNLFNMTRHLRNRGFDATLILLNSDNYNFMPNEDMIEEGPYEHAHQVSWGDFASFMTTTAARVREDLEPYDFLIGCGTAPAFVTYAERRLDLFTPFGADVYELPFYRPKRFTADPVWSRDYIRYQWHYARMCRLQRRGIGQTREIFCSHPDKRPFFRRCGFTRLPRDLDTCLLYTPMLESAAFDEYCRRTPHYELMRRLREESDLLILHPARQYWLSAPDRFSEKGNDRLIRAFARLCREGPAKSPSLVMVEHGSDCSASQELVQKLGISDYVHWLPRSPRIDLMGYMRFADVVANEFVVSSLAGGIVYEALASGVPLMSFRDDKLYRNAFRELYPMLNVHDADEIYTALADVSQRPQYYRSLGETGREWHRNIAERSTLEVAETLITASAAQPPR